MDEGHDIPEDAYLRAAPCMTPTDGDAAFCPPETGAPPPSATPRCNVDIARVCPSGYVLIIGWADDAANPLTDVSLLSPAGFGLRSWRGFGRVRRADVEDALRVPPGYAHGFWLIGKLPGRFAAADPGAWRVQINCANGTAFQAAFAPAMVTSAALLDSALLYLIQNDYAGPRTARIFHALDGGNGKALIDLNAHICDQIVANPAVEHFGPRTRPVHTSIIVPLYGRAHYFFLQNALFHAGPGIAGCEFIYIVNDPSLIDTLGREARIAERIYGLPVTLAFLPGNAGFGRANNLGAGLSRAARLLFINPDVLPKTPDWAARHTAIVDQAPAEQTALFGTTLYYADGSLMHGGMYIESDTGLSVQDGQIDRQTMLRVEHYGKGAPALPALTRPRPVPAVTGAFISTDRAWFERLDGFSPDYIFGHYEDADLCLRSRDAGRPVWLHDIPMWHLEGKGADWHPAHEAAAQVNRWTFSRAWRTAV